MDGIPIAREQALVHLVAGLFSKLEFLKIETNQHVDAIQQEQLEYGCAQHSGSGILLGDGTRPMDWDQGDIKVRITLEQNPIRNDWMDWLGAVVSRPKTVRLRGRGVLMGSHFLWWWLKHIGGRELHLEFLDAPVLYVAGRHECDQAGTWERLSVLLPRDVEMDRLSPPLKDYSGIVQCLPQAKTLRINLPRVKNERTLSFQGRNRDELMEWYKAMDLPQRTHATESCTTDGTGPDRGGTAVRGVPRVPTGTGRRRCHTGRGTMAPGCRGVSPRWCVAFREPSERGDNPSRSGSDARIGVVWVCDLSAIERQRGVSSRGEHGVFTMEQKRAQTCSAVQSDALERFATEATDEALSGSL